MNFRVEFDTMQFVRAHGKAPRGQGSWAFIDARLANANDYLDHVMWFNGTYARAKELARMYFAARNVAVVVVLS